MSRKCFVILLNHSCLFCKFDFLQTSYTRGLKTIEKHSCLLKDMNRIIRPNFEEQSTSSIYRLKWINTACSNDSNGHVACKYPVYWNILSLLFWEERTQSSPWAEILQFTLYCYECMCFWAYNTSILITSTSAFGEEKLWKTFQKTILKHFI